MTVDGDGLRVELDQVELPRGEETRLGIRVVEQDGSAVTDFEVEHERKMHLIVARRDLTGFQHLHPEMADDGTWSTEIILPAAGTYRVFADFNHAGNSLTLGEDLTVRGDADYQELPAQESEFETASGYSVSLGGDLAEARQESELAFKVVRKGEAIEVEPYLGADGHLVALREGDLAFLHVHPMGGGGVHGEHAHPKASKSGDGIRFMTEFPSEGRYRLFLQFKHGGEVHTAEFTREVSGQAAT